MGVYLYGTRTLSSLPVPYLEPVKQYAVDTFATYQIDDALTKGYISQEEYDETIALKPPVDPQ